MRLTRRWRDHPAIRIAESAAVAALVAKLLRVCVVGCNETNCTIGAAMLRQAGHMPLLTEDGATAVSVAGAENFDVILVDVRMPDIDGLEAARRICRRPAARCLWWR